MMKPHSRRQWLQMMFGATGAAGINNLLAAPTGLYTGPRTPGKAKHVISLFLSGGPSHVDLFDPKPALVKFQGQRPGSVELRTERQTGGLMPSPFLFKPRGQSGIEMSEMIPQLATVADELCVIRS